MAVVALRGGEAKRVFLNGHLQAQKFDIFMLKLLQFCQFEHIFNFLRHKGARKYWGDVGTGEPIVKILEKVFLTYLIIFS